MFQHLPYGGRRHALTRLPQNDAVFVNLQGNPESILGGEEKQTAGLLASRPALVTITALMDFCDPLMPSYTRAEQLLLL